MKKSSGGDVAQEMVRARSLGREMAARGVDTLTLLNFADVEWPGQAKLKGAFFDGVTEGLKD